MIDDEKDKTGEVGFCTNCGRTVEVHKPIDDRLQWRIFNAVRLRGYLNGWSPSQFLARQAAKMAEELGEASVEMSSYLPVALFTTIQAAADEGKYHFDHEKWKEGYWDQENLERLWNEISDMQVVLVCMAMAANALLDDQRDLLKAALLKAAGDIPRGVRRH